LFATDDRNRIDHLQIFFHRFKIPSLLTGNDLPKYTDKKVRAYNPLELGKLFGRATADQSDLLHFLLCTGTREQEAQFVCWSDVDLERQTYTVTEYLDLGYRPKDKEEGTLPIPELLVQTLKDRRKRYPHTRLIFTGKRGKPNGHALRTIKRLALRAGVNCGQCVNKARKSCATHPVCRHTFASQNTQDARIHPPPQGAACSDLAAILKALGAFNHPSLYYRSARRSGTGHDQFDLQRLRAGWRSDMMTPNGQ
jgi:integrase